ncbi:hypothetical protein ABAC460_10580 [Asticcacaulis sp. AC460]|uniref:PhnD/SsuA/transferrin family substrate-binding protein n=1 Tax=Asticcacaulis sp. AC460 TaxID=1282360 RepID=UPI0003C3FD96|nr:PhnD/SsuA/transferrin family substrate-binding protein [Asticcacaulis sp. AC460]ESQ90188.1 hypothetical protein ABAC460_10580 [Asticcacaulis sp. AC460]
MRILTPVFAFALLLLAACSPGGQNTSAADQAKVVRIASIGYYADGKLNVGGNQTAAVYTRKVLEERLAKRGVTVEWVPISQSLGGPGFNEALASKKVDFAAYGDFPAIIARAGGIPIKLVVPAGRGSNSYLVVPAGSKAQSIEDLKGKSIALQRGRPGELAFNQLISSKGLTRADFKIFNIAADAAASSLAAGQIDAAFIGPAAYLLEDKGVGRVIWSSKGTNWKWRSELFVREDFSRDNPGLTQEVVEGYISAAYWSSQDANREEAQTLISRNGTPLSVVQRDSENDIEWKAKWSPLFDGYMEEHYRDAVAFTSSEKLIPQAFDVKDFFEPKYVEQALKNQKLEGYWTARQGSK